MARRKQPVSEVDPLDPFAHLPPAERERREAEVEAAYIADGIAHAAEADAAEARRVHYGYVRVSTDKQDTGSDAQRRALVRAGCMTIIEEQASGRKARPALAALIDQLAAGDTLTVYRFDRISRSVADFYAIGERIRGRGASLRSVVESFDTSTPMGRAMMGFAAIWAELEADTTRERVNNGLRAARARGQLLGRRTKLTAELEREIAAALDAGEQGKPLARKHQVSARTIRRIKQRHAQRGLPLGIAANG